MPAKVRVYELARELDITNKQIIALCESLGIDAKSHSSSLVEAQADRVRKKAESDGLVKSKPTSKESQSENITLTEDKESENSEAKKVSKSVSSKKPPPKKTKPRSAEQGVAQEQGNDKPVVSSRKTTEKSKNENTKVENKPAASAAW